MPFANPLLAPSQYQLSFRRASLPLGFHATNNIFTGMDIFERVQFYLQLYYASSHLTSIQIGLVVCLICQCNISCLMHIFLKTFLLKTCAHNHCNQFWTKCFECLSHISSCISANCTICLQTFLQRRFPKPYLANAKKICISQFASFVCINLWTKSCLLLHLSHRCTMCTC